MTHDHNPLLVDYDRQRDDARHAHEPFDWLLSLERTTPRTRRLFRRLASAVSR